jgi:hypothetical protein
VERHRNDHVDVGEEFAAGADHPVCHEGGEIEPIAIFEAMHQIAGNLVESRDRPAPPERRRIGDRFR